jgi:hypothetical protein
LGNYCISLEAAHLSRLSMTLRQPESEGRPHFIHAILSTSFLLPDFVHEVRPANGKGLQPTLQQPKDPIFPY